MNPHSQPLNFSPAAGDGPGPTGGGGLHRRVLLAGLCISLFLIVVGARWWLIGGYGSDVPYWDQWDAEAALLYKPYFEERLKAADWFAPHNEHRIFFSRVLALGLLLANGQWDARLEMTVNAVLYALVCCGLFLVLVRGRSLAFAATGAGGLAFLFSLPFGWENSLAGFQSQFYLLAGFSLIALYCLANGRAGSGLWALGLLSGAAALVTMASGLLAPLAVLGFLALRTVREWAQRRGLWRESWPTALASLLFLIAGLALSVRVAGHDFLKAHSIGDFLTALLTCMAWPHYEKIWALVSWLPFAMVLWRYLKGEPEDGPERRFVLALGLWTALQAAAMSYSRAGTVEAPRYSDILSFGLVANGLCAWWLWEGAKKGQKKFWMVFLLVWSVANGVDLTKSSFTGDITKRWQTYETERIRTAGFVATGDEQYFRDLKQSTDIPHPDLHFLAGILRDPVIRRLLPAGIQKPLSLESVRGPAPVPVDRPGLPPHGPIAPELWDRPDLFSPVAVVGPLQPFEYRVAGGEGKSFLLLHLLGEGTLTVRDAEGGSHDLYGLPLGKSEWRRFFAYCPGACRISGKAGTSGIAVASPLEAGPGSIGALIAGRWGWAVFASGVVLFALILFVVLRGMPDWPVMGRGEARAFSR